MEEEKCCCHHKTKERSEKEYKDLIHRLNRIEGQIRGIKGMVEKDAYCPEILVQVAAANAALNSFNKVLLANHIRTCVADAKWVYENCNGASISIIDGQYKADDAMKGPLGKKALTPLRGAANFDPTDPAV